MTRDSRMVSTTWLRSRLAARLANDDSSMTNAESHEDLWTSASMPSPAAPQESTCGTNGTASDGRDLSSDGAEPFQEQARPILTLDAAKGVLLQTAWAVIQDTVGQGVGYEVRIMDTPNSAPDPVMWLFYASRKCVQGLEGALLHSATLRQLLDWFKLSEH